MRRQAPPLEAIESFILATRSESFRAAADALALSPSALSRRIQALEAFLGVPLFDRAGGATTLTAAGRQYLDEVAPALEQIRVATAALSARGEGDPLVVLTPQSFAMGWLVPRLSAFMAAHPQVQVSIRISQSLRDLRTGDADLAIVTGPRNMHGLPSEALVGLEGCVVAAARLADGRPPPTRLEELVAFPRLAVYRPERLWESWLEQVDYRGPSLAEPVRFESMFVMYEAAAAGLGVALGVPLLMERFLHDGRLARCLPPTADIGVQYHLVFANPAVRRWQEVRIFREWLTTEMARSALAVKDLGRTQTAAG